MFRNDVFFSSDIIKNLKNGRPSVVLELSLEKMFKKSGFYFKISKPRCF